MLFDDARGAVACVVFSHAQIDLSEFEQYLQSTWLLLDVDLVVAMLGMLK